MIEMCITTEELVGKSEPQWRCAYSQDQNTGCVLRKSTVLSVSLEVEEEEERKRFESVTLWSETGSFRILLNSFVNLEFELVSFAGS